MRLSHKLLKSQKGITLAEVLVASAIFGAIALYVTRIQTTKISTDKTIERVTALENYSNVFLKVVDRNDSLNPQDNICYQFFSGINSSLTSGVAGRHQIVPADSSIRITAENLDILSGSKPFFASQPGGGGYMHGQYRLDYLELTSGVAGLSTLKQIDPPSSGLYEHLFKGQVRFVFTDTKTGLPVKTKGSTLLFAFGTELISCSSMSKVNFSLVGRCDIWGPHSRVIGGDCKVPYHNGGGVVGDPVDWTNLSDINVDKGAKQTLCDLQRRAGVTEGMVCD